MKTKSILCVIAMFFLFSSLNAQEITGLWKTIDDETGKEKSYVELSIKDGKLYGTITTL